MEVFVTQLPEGSTELIRALNCTFRFVVKAKPFELNAAGKPVQKGEPELWCEVQDLTTKEFYASAKGSDEAEALMAALNAAVDAEKPLTPAQQVQKRLKNEIAAKDATMSEKDKELAELREMVAQLQTQAGITPPVKRGPGRPRKEVAVEA